MVSLVIRVATIIIAIKLIRKDLQNGHAHVRQESKPEGCALVHERLGKPAPDAVKASGLPLYSSIFPNITYNRYQLAESPRYALFSCLPQKRHSHVSGKCDSVDAGDLVTVGGAF